MSGTGSHCVGISRRDLLTMSTAHLLVVTAAGCDALATDPERQNSQQSGGSTGAAMQAPDLKAMVEAGELPAVEERLPDDPVIIEPVARIGVYGGTWNSGLVGVADAVYLRYIVGYDNLVRWRPSLEWSASYNDVIPRGLFKTPFD